jgi:hypothetical protein
MDLSFSQEDRDFQQDVQSFLKAAWPQEMRDKKIAKRFRQAV